MEKSAETRSFAEIVTELTLACRVMDRACEEARFACARALVLLQELRETPR